jgi:hypothetical protein
LHYSQQGGMSFTFSSHKRKRLDEGLIDASMGVEPHDYRCQEASDCEHFSDTSLQGPIYAFRAFDYLFAIPYSIIIRATDADYII